MPNYNAKPTEQHKPDRLRHRLLSRSEEKALLRLAQKGDRRAVALLVECNQKFVARIASRYQTQGKHLSFDDLMQEGSLGLIRAIEKFDLSQNTRLLTYAKMWINQKLQRAIAKQQYTIRQPFDTRYLQWQIQQLAPQLQEQGLPVTVQNLAERLQVQEKLVKRAIDLKAIDCSISIDCLDGGIPGPALPVEDDHDRAVMIDRIERAIVNCSTDDCVRQMVRMRIGLATGEPMGFREIATRLNRSVSWANAAYVRALKRIQPQIEDLREGREHIKGRHLTPCRDRSRVQEVA